MERHCSSSNHDPQLWDFRPVGRGGVHPRACVPGLTPRDRMKRCKRWLHAIMTFLLQKHGTILFVFKSSSDENPWYWNHQLSISTYWLRHLGGRQTTQVHNSIIRSNEYPWIYLCNYLTIDTSLYRIPPPQAKLDAYFLLSVHSNYRQDIFVRTPREANATPQMTESK